MASEGCAGCRVEVDADGGLLRLVLDNPPDNRLTPSILQALGRVLDDLESGKAPGLLVVTGSGRSFSKGFDEAVIREVAEAKAQRASLLLWNDILSRLAASRSLTIAAVNGACFGGGLELALACHLRFCSEKARLGLPELGLGLLPGLGGIHRLVHLVGRSKSLELLIAGDLITAAEGHRIGLVNRLLPHDGLEAGVKAFATSLSTLRPSLIGDVIKLTALAERCRGDDNVAAMVDAVVGGRDKQDP